MTRRSAQWALAALTITVGAASCSKDPPAGGTPAASAAATAPLPTPAFHVPVLAKLKEAGLAPGEMEATAAKPYLATACVRGAVSKLDLLLCSYPSAEAARAAEPKLAEFVGTAVTGVVRSAGTLALAVADREKVDLGGKQINKLVKLVAE